MKIFLLLFLITSVSWGRNYPKRPTDRVVAIAVDGVREKDAGPIKALQVDFTINGYHTTWLGAENGCKTSQPYNMSLPAYANYFTGSFDQRISSNFFKGKLNRKTLFDIYPNSQAFSSWGPLKNVVSDNRVIRDENTFIVYRPDFPASPNDPLVAEAFKHFYLQSRFSFVHFSDADDYAHLGDWRNYKDSVKREATLIKDIVAHTETITKEKPTVIIFSDHSRGTWFQWKHHRRGVVGSEKIWILIASPERLPFAFPICDHTSLHGITRAILGE